MFIGHQAKKRVISAQALAGTGSHRLRVVALEEGGFTSMAFDKSRFTQQLFCRCQGLNAQNLICCVKENKQGTLSPSALMYNFFARLSQIEC